MKFLSNIYDPNRPDASQFVSLEGNETQDQAWANHLRWLKGKVIGNPQATTSFSAEELKALHMVGVYQPDHRVQNE